MTKYAHRPSKVEQTVVLMSAARARQARRFGLASVFILWITAGALGGIGAWSLLTRRQFILNELSNPRLEEHLPRTSRQDLWYSVYPSYMATATGGAGLVVGFLGLLAVFRQSSRLFAAVICSLLLLLLAHLATGVVGLMYRKTLQEDVRIALKNDLQIRISTYEYPDEHMDAVQREFSCCGAEGPDDWDMNGNFSCAGGRSFCGVPRSCCRQLSPDCGSQARVSDGSGDETVVFTVGCVDNDKMDSWRIETLDLLLLSASAFGLALFVVMALVLAAVYLHRIQGV
eukprot:m.308735 g.308735  ORF g.308735 m.308735 type:complete len:286 (+) comp44640_c0_seq1:388-1245(+)